MEWANQSKMESLSIVRIADLQSAEENPRLLTPHYRALLATSLKDFGWLNPIIVNRVTGRILTGHQRTTVAKEDLGWTHAPAIYVSISPEQEKKAVVFLNDISGNWNFRSLDNMQAQHHAQMSRLNLGSAYTGDVLNGESFDKTNADHRAAVKDYLGDQVVDYGAGKMTEFKILRQLGIEAIGYDPYQKDPNRKKNERSGPSVEHTRKLAREFFADLCLLEGPFTVVNQAVLSSIAYPETRHDVVTILAALTYIGGKFCSITARSIEDSAYNEMRINLLRINRGKPQNILMIPDESEENLFVTGVSNGKRIHQKYFTLPEFVSTLGGAYDPEGQCSFGGFDAVDAEIVRGFCFARGFMDQPPETYALQAALKSQFGDLQIDGEKLDLADEAIQTFEYLISRKQSQP